MRFCSISISAVLVAVFTIPAVAQTTQPTDAPVAPTPIGEMQELVVGEGDAASAEGGFQVAASLWRKSFEGERLGGAAPIEVVMTVETPNFPGLARLASGMKVGGKRRIALPASEVFGQQVLTNSGLPADENIYIEAELTKVFAPEPFEITTITEGSGDEVTETGSRVKMHYTGWTDGFDGEKKFDSSRDRGQPFGLALGKGQVIEGWERGLLGMKVGERRHLSIPHYYAYGQRAQGAIPAYARLFFDVELVEIVHPVEFKTEIMKEGEGAPAVDGDKVRVHYSGWLDGFGGDQLFDSSHNEGRQPIEFVLGKSQVIKGWEQGVVGMKPGEVRRLTIPYDLAYGERGRPPQIPAFSTLYFEVEYLSLVEIPKAGELGSETMKEGDGEPVKEGDKVRVHYTGWLDDFGGAQEFDSSRKPGREPFSFVVGRGQVIQGWDQGVTGMKPGEVRRLTIPYNLAYGEQGRPPVIPAFATLYFEIEYLGLGQ